MANKCGFTYVDLMLPSFSKDAEAMKKWACVACDQYTSEPEYWNAVEALVGDAPSTLNLMLPEIYLSQTVIPYQIFFMPSATLREFQTTN